AMLLVALEYDAQGIAHDVQMSYLLRTGGQMLALTLLMVAVAVAVGFIASRVSAAIGRDLRRDVFRTVVGYSNAEIEKFSTASLITRTTNDIQQVQ
ncbi:MAG TPA: ABC transporter, partial [Subdoligranulum sp.]|nr:ABC transporter [Subdoligranulum sp.]